MAMSLEEETFKNYIANHYSKWQKKILLISWVVAIIILCIEIFTYTTLLKNGKRVVFSFSYIFLRIITPTILNFGTLLISTHILNIKKFSINTKNHWVSASIFMICAVLAIFHNYFQILLISPGIAFFICAVFGETKILHRLLYATIPVAIISGITFWLDPDSKDLVYKLLTIICSTAFISCAYIFAKAVMNSQKTQLNYIHSSYRKQLELIEELKIEPLTKLYNRVAMDGTINRILSRVKTETINPFLVIMDIDFFKKVNDKYGHTSGDEVLVTLAEIIKKNMGSVRKAFRFGGEEFVLIFENSMPSTVIYTIQSIRKDFSSTKFKFAPDKSFTLSAGISPLHNSFTAKDWLNRADKCLYYAKEHGRDQIKVDELTT